MKTLPNKRLKNRETASKNCGRKPKELHRKDNFNRLTAHSHPQPTLRPVTHSSNFMSSSLCLRHMHIPTKKVAEEKRPAIFNHAQLYIANKSAPCF